MLILGISAFYHDSAACLIEKGEILAAAQEERFTRKKQDASFPTNAVRYCLQHAGISIADLDAIVFYDKPLLKFERLLDTYYAFAPQGVVSFVSAIPVWLKEKMFLKKLIRDELSEIGEYDRKKLKLLFPEHHLSHAASAFFPSPFDEAAILTVDGVGEWATASICKGQANKIEICKEMHFPHSVGLLYSAFTYYLGFRVNSGEYKLMGLAPYGDPKSERTAGYIKSIEDKLIDIKEDGSIWLNQKYFKYATALRMTHNKRWQKLFGFARRKPEEAIGQDHCNLAYAIQHVTEKIILKMAEEAKRLTGMDNICLAGGVALNCVANGKLLRGGMFKDMFIQPAAGDAGGALGAALAAWHIYYSNDRQTGAQDSMKGSLLGPAYSDRQIEVNVGKYQAVYHRYEDFGRLCEKTAGLIEEGKAIGWFQGRMEYGPRALGNRSILGDARKPEMQKKLNVKIKYRESFRPFAPSVLAEDNSTYFELEHDSPYMLLVADVKEQRRNTLPANYHQLPLKEKLYHLRSDVPAITHLDFSARVQTVHKEVNPRYYQLIDAFKQRTGHGIIVNTSFNVRGEPIVCTPGDAYRCFMRTQMDALVVGNYLFLKEEQPESAETDDWKEEFPLD